MPGKEKMSEPAYNLRGEGHVLDIFDAEARLSQELADLKRLRAVSEAPSLGSDREYARYFMELPLHRGVRISEVTAALDEVRAELPVD